jgi:hypothetical protein
MSQRKVLPDGLNKLFSTPSLMSGEDPKAYAELYAWVAELADPKDVWDHMMVADVTNHIWEQQRYRRCTGAIIDSRRRAALLKILGEAVGLNPYDAMDIADIHFGVIRYEENDRAQRYSDPAQIPTTPAEVIQFLKKHGITEEYIDGVAMECSADTLATIENLALKHELRREAILREIERRRERRAQEQPSPAARQLEGESRALTRDHTHVSAPSLIRSSK